MNISIQWLTRTELDPKNPDKTVNILTNEFILDTTYDFKKKGVNLAEIVQLAPGVESVDIERRYSVQGLMGALFDRQDFEYEIKRAIREAAENLERN